VYEYGKYGCVELAQTGIEKEESEATPKESIMVI
jgi:hypothetical protein